MGVVQLPSVGGRKVTGGELDRARLETSLAALRRELTRLDLEADEWIAAYVRRRSYLVEVVWTVKDALGLPDVDEELERSLDEALERESGLPPERVAILRAIREASRPR